MKNIDLTKVTSFFLFAIIFSCQKDKLKDEKEIFIGKWNWTTSYRNEFCNPPYSLDDTLKVGSYPHTYALDFKKNGILYAYLDNVEFYKKKITFKHFYKSETCPDDNYFRFALNLSNKLGSEEGDNYMDGCICEDSLVLFWNFPFITTDCDYYTNYFVKE